MKNKNFKNNRGGDNMKTMSKMLIVWCWCLCMSAALFADQKEAVSQDEVLKRVPIEQKITPEQKSLENNNEEQLLLDEKNC